MCRTLKRAPTFGPHISRDQISLHKDVLFNGGVRYDYYKTFGRATYEEMKAINGNLKVLFVSGYTADIMEQKGFDGKEINFLSKPIVPKVFAAKVREVLDA
jgi:hypothetical protein